MHKFTNVFIVFTLFILNKNGFTTSFSTKLFARKPASRSINDTSNSWTENVLLTIFHCEQMIACLIFRQQWETQMRNTRVLMLNECAGSHCSWWSCKLLPGWINQTGVAVCCLNESPLDGSTPVTRKRYQKVPRGKHGSLLQWFLANRLAWLCPMLWLPTAHSLPSLLTWQLEFKSQRLVPQRLHAELSMSTVRN